MEFRFQVGKLNHLGWVVREGLSLETCFNSFTKHPASRECLVKRTMNIKDTSEYDRNALEILQA